MARWGHKIINFCVEINVTQWLTFIGDAEGTGILGRDNYIYSGASATDIDVDEPVRRK